MGVDAQLKPRKGKSLGSAAEVRAAFERAFPVMRFTRSSNVGKSDDELRGFAKMLLPAWTRVVLFGPTAPYFYQGDLGEKGWAIQVSFDDSAMVPAAFLSLYGDFGPAITKLDELTSELPWKLKVY